MGISLKSMISKKARGDVIMKEYMKPKLGVYSLNTDERFASTVDCTKEEWVDSGEAKWTYPSAQDKTPDCVFQNIWVMVPVS